MSQLHLPCRCDAQAIVCIVIEQGFGSDAVDTVLVDLSTLRSSDTSEASSGIGCCGMTCAKQDGKWAMLIYSRDILYATICSCQHCFLTTWGLQVETEIKSTASNFGCSLSQQQTQIPFTIEVQNMALTTSAEDHTTVHA